jgi:hypothetical protein
MGLALLGLTAGCSAKARRLDPDHADEEYRARMKLRYERGVTSPALLARIEPGDIIASSADDDSGGSSTAWGIALSQIPHVAIVFPFYQGRKLRLLTADSENGVYVQTLEKGLAGRDFTVYTFPKGLLDLKRLEQFALRAADLGDLEYDWSALWGWNSNIHPNTLAEVDDEYTCATVVAAALHYAGLSLDRAWRGVITPGDIVFSIARRNLNGPGGPAVEEEPLPPPRARSGSPQKKSKPAPRTAPGEPPPGPAEEP